MRRLLVCPRVQGSQPCSSPVKQLQVAAAMCCPGLCALQPSRACSSPATTHCHGLGMIAYVFGRGGTRLLCNAPQRLAHAGRPSTAPAPCRPASLPECCLAVFSCPLAPRCTPRCRTFMTCCSRHRCRCGTRTVRWARLVLCKHATVQSHHKVKAGCSYMADGLSQGLSINITCFCADVTVSGLSAL